MTTQVAINREEVQNSDLSREQILDLAKAAGNKLGFLLAMSPLTDEQKEGFVNILEFAEPEQIDKLTQILEDSYLEANNKSLEEDFKKGLEIIKSEFEKQQASLDEDCVAKLDQIQAKIV